MAVDVDRQNIIDRFHVLYHGSRVWDQNTRWFGVPAQKPPLDLWIYQEIIFEIKPDIIIETGTAYGGTALFLANMCDLIGKGMVITIDTASRQRPKHDRIQYLLGSSISNDVAAAAKKFIRPNDKVMVILDSVHHKDYVLKEIALYGNLVSVGSYLIVEDTCMNNHPVRPDFGPGPMEAVDEFLKTNKSFVSDRGREKFLMTFHPKGFLKRIGR